jgi:hexulose-6-phosphate isomerase
MRKSISQWAFLPDQPLDTSLALAADAGFAGIEITLDADPDGSKAALGVLTLEAMEPQAERVLELTQKRGLEIASVATGLLWDSSLTAEDPAERARALDIARTLIRSAHLLGTDCVLVIPGVVDAPFAPQVPPVPYEVCYQRSQEAVRELLPYCEEQGVQLGLEPVWNMCLLSPLEWRDYLDGFSSPYAGVYFDVANVLNTGYPEQWIRLLGHRLARVHFKDFKRSVGTLDGFCDLLEGDVNWTAVMAALREVGYEGWVTAEMFPSNPAGAEHLIYSTSQAMDYIFAL